jgi:hypothetical protein
LRKLERKKQRQMQREQAKIDQEANRIKQAELMRVAEENKTLAKLIYNHEADMPTARPIIIDRHLVAKFRTKMGGFTSNTLNVIRQIVPLDKGWASRLVGKEISEDACRDALQGRESRHTVANMRKAGMTYLLPTVKL